MWFKKKRKRKLMVDCFFCDIKTETTKEEIEKIRLENQDTIVLFGYKVIICNKCKIYQKYLEEKRKFNKVNEKEKSLKEYIKKRDKFIDGHTIYR